MAKRLGPDGQPLSKSSYDRSIRIVPSKKQLKAEQRAKEKRQGEKRIKKGSRSRYSS